MLKSKRARMGAVLASGVVATTIGFTALTTGTATEAFAAGAPIWGTCTGAQQGVIKSDVTTLGHSGQWVLTKLTDGITTPFDSATGLPTGRHLEQGIHITMSASPASIGLIQAETANENLSTCTFTFYRTTARGTLQAYLQLKLTNAKVVSYALSGTPTTGAATSFGFVAQHIQRTWLITNKSASDDWSAPVG